MWHIIAIIGCIWIVAAGLLAWLWARFHLAMRAADERDAAAARGDLDGFVAGLRQ